ncbi:hypothetical protein [Hymenobacter terricola]|uniref:hypothetical protein n=1 Tax=Hymenobacter terricola TaxID=2819236 RepID=UPI001B315333|nr:hypothetical protein [Hymenobacter terricola]
MKNSWHLIKARLEAKARGAEEAAGYQGSYSDGGASAIRTAIYYYEAGMYGQLPLGWNEIDDQLAKEADPEYQKLQQLKQKFEE